MNVKKILSSPTVCSPEAKEPAMGHAKKILSRENEKTSSAHVENRDGL